MLNPPKQSMGPEVHHFEDSQADARDNFILDPNFSGGHTIGHIGARDLIFSSSNEPNE